MIIKYFIIIIKSRGNKSKFKFMGKTDTLLIFSITILSMLVIGLVIYDQTTDTETN